MTVPKIPESAVARRLLAYTAAALAAIVGAALFFIAPVWQFSGPAAGYTSPALRAAAGNPGEGMVDVNEAGAETLMTLPGVGPATAQAILAWREEHGAFTSLADLEQADGVSQRMIEQWEHLAYTGNSDYEIR